MLKSLVCSLNTRAQNVTVADPDPPPGSRPSDRGKGWGGGHPDPEIRGGAVSKTFFFRPSGLILCFFRVMKKILHKFHQEALTVIFLVIFARIA